MSKTIEFSGFNWQVKQSQTKVGPGPNLFSEKGVNLVNGELKLEVIETDGQTLCAEIILDKPLGYGKYTFQLSSRIDLLHDDLVFGLFTWSDNAPPPNCEIDIEFSRWGNLKNANTQFVIQPHDTIGNKLRFETKLMGEFTTHIIEWMHEIVRFYSYHGHLEGYVDNDLLIRKWSYSGSDIPEPNDERIHINLYKSPYRRSKSMQGGVSYAIINKFIFEPFQMTL